MTYEVRENTDAQFVLVNKSGNFARTTSCEFFTTPDRAKAIEAAAFVNQPSSPMRKRVGENWLKSTFGVF